MPNYTGINERYRDWYCEEIIESYLNYEIDLEDLIFKLDYDKVQEQIELFNTLNLILTNEYPHKCYNKNCQKKLFFSNSFNNAKEHLKLPLKEFVIIWIAPYNLKQYEGLNISIPFFCCDCYKKNVHLEKLKK
jgi:hypothetical protein